MDLQVIDRQFKTLIMQRGIHRQLGLKSYQVRNCRQRLKNGMSVSLKVKLLYLQKCNRLIEPKEYTRNDLQALVTFLYKENVEHDPDYAVHKFLLQKGKNVPAEFVNNGVVEVIKKIRSSR